MSEEKLKWAKAQQGRKYHIYFGQAAAACNAHNAGLPMMKPIDTIPPIELRCKKCMKFCGITE